MLSAFIAENFWLVLLIGAGIVLRRYRIPAIISVMILVLFPTVPLWVIISLMGIGVLVDFVSLQQKSKKLK